jgi:hypothetical protein
MPLYWTIDSKKQLVVVTGEGDVTRADMEEYLDVVEGAGALTYRKLFDLTAAPASMSEDDLLALGARIRSYHSQPVGPLALVVQRDRVEALARILGILAAADRPMRIFTRLGPAKRWIESLVRPENTPP